MASLIISVSSGHFPPPTTPEELGARILIQERYEKYGESEEVEMEVESEDEDDERPERSHGQPSQPDQDTQVQDMDEVSAKKANPSLCHANSLDTCNLSFFPLIVADCFFFLCQHT